MASMRTPSPKSLQVEQSTDGSQASENWGMLMEICDIINETEEGPKDAGKAIKKRLATSGKNYTVVLYTLTVLETCVKNCGRRFHVQIAHKDFMQEMVKIIGPKNDPPAAVQEKVLSMIQTWADAFQGQPDLKEVCKVYQELKNKGIEFPMTDLDSMAPIHTPARVNTGRMSPPVSQPQYNPAIRAAGPPPGMPPPQQAMPPPQQQQQMHHMPQQPVETGPVMLSSEQLGKLKSELDVVQQNCRVFSEMLTELTPGQDNPSDMELLNELNRTCKHMQQRIMELIDKVQNEEVTCELLHINDELNNVFLRYERFERLRAGQAGQRQTSPTHATTNSQAPPSYNQVSNQAPSQPPTSQAPAPGVPPPSRVPNQPPAAGKGAAPVGNLIDFGETPSPQPAPQSDPFSTHTNDINARLAGMSVGNNVSSTLDGIPSTQATTGSQRPPVNSDDFDMFAQSRQAFDENKQQLPGQGSSTYKSQQQDQYPGGLGSALTAKSTGNPFNPQGNNLPPELVDTENELEEMEQWLKENPTSSEPATSSEFDRFLQDRAADSQDTNRSGGTNNRRQMQKDQQEDAMFAL